MSIDFRDTEPFHDHVRETIVFIGRYGTRRIRCAISIDALKERFGATGNSLAELFDAFLPNQAAIQEAASRKFRDVGRNVDAVLLRPRDF